MIDGWRKKLFQSVLDKFVESHETKIGTGSFSLTNLRLKKDLTFSYFRLIHGSISSVSLEVSLRFYHLNADQVHLVIRLNDDISGTSRSGSSRRQQLAERLSEGLWGYMLNRIVLNISKLHIKLEHKDFSYGFTLENFTFRNGQASVEYCSLYCDCIDPDKPLIDSLPFSVVDSIMSQSLPTSESLPHHQYLIRPIPSITMQLELSLSLPATAVISLRLSDVSLKLLDVQCISMVSLLDSFQHLKNLKAYKYRKRPQHANEWWWYSFRAIRYLMRQGFGPRRWRRRYMDLFERNLLDAIEASELVELMAIEEGRLGDLDPTDIDLYQQILRKRHNKPHPSWLGLSIQEQESYNEMWAEFPVSTVKYKLSQIVVSFQMTVLKGNLILQSPLSSTLDEPFHRRLQQDFLDISFGDFQAMADLLGDLETLQMKFHLSTIEGSEICSDRSRRVMMKCVDDGPFLSLLFVKKPPTDTLFDIGLEGQINRLEILLAPDSDWIYQLKPLIQPLPSYQKVSKFWKALSLASINTWASRKLGILAKMERVKDRKRLNIDLRLHCPNLCIQGGGVEVRVELGYVHAHTKKLAGISGSLLPRQLNQIVRTSSKRANGGVSDANQSFLGTIGPDIVVQDASVAMGSIDDLFIHDETFLENAVSDLGPEEIFYDVFEIDIGLGGITLLGTQSSDYSTLLAPVASTITVLKSTIPADQTLSRYRISSMIGDVSFRADPLILLDLRKLFTSWEAFFSSSHWQFPATPIYAQESRLVRGESMFAFDTENRYEDDMTDEEFLDAIEANSSAGESTGELLQEDLMIDSGSLFDVASRSSASRKRRQRRNRSVSDASSLSDGSTSKRSKRVTFDNGYLSAENLAKLDEGMDEESYDKLESFEDATFGSAMTPNRIQDLVDRLESQIDLVVADYASLTSLLSGLSATDHRSKALQLKIRRRRTEITTLRAYLTSLRTDEHVASRSEIAFAALQALEAQLKGMSSAEEDPRSSTSEHDLITTSGGELFHLFAKFDSISVQVCSVSEDADSVIRLDIQNVSFLAKKKVRSVKAFFRAESLSLNAFEGGVSAPLLLCGAIGNPGDPILPLSTKFPQFLSTASSEEPFLQLGLELQTPTASEEITKQRVKVRCAVGDVESQISSSGFRLLQHFYSHTKVQTSTPSSSRQTGSANKKCVHYIDAQFQISNIRLSVSEPSPVLLVVALGDISLHCMGSKSSLLDGKTRLQVGGRWTSFQLLDIFGSNFECCNEILSKKGVFDPFLRARCRLHLLDRSDPDDWVVGWGRPNEVSTCEWSSTAAINAHAGLRIDGLTFHVLPDSLERLASSTSFIRSLLSASKGRQSSPEASETVPSSSRLEVRWRAHIDARNLRISIRPWPDTSSPVETFVNFSMKSEPSDERHGIFVAVDVHDLRIWDQLSEREIMKVLDASLNSFFLPHLGNPVFRALSFNRNYQWNTSQISRKCSEVFPDTDMTSISSAVSSFHLCISTNFLRNLLSWKKELERMSRKGSTEIANQKPAFQMKSSRKFSFSCSIRSGEAELQLLRGSSNANMVLERALQISFTTMKGKLSVGNDFLDFSTTIESLGLRCKIRNTDIQIFDGCSANQVEGQNGFLSASFARGKGNGAYVHIGSAKFLLVPQSAQTVLSILNDLKVKSTPEPAYRESQLNARPSRYAVFPFTLQVVCDEFQLCLPSQDIYRLSPARDTISVILIRNQICLKVSLTELLGGVDEDTPTDKQASSSFNSQKLYMIKSHCECKDIQAIRTLIKQNKESSFEILSADTGDHEITNSFTVSVGHECVFASHGTSQDDFLVSMAHVLTIESTSIDTIAYIKPSPGGINDAMKISVIPFVDAFKKAKSTGNESKTKASIGVRENVCRCPTLVKVEINSLRLTCVPGGSTRTTESPSLKFELRAIQASGAMIAVPADAKLLSRKASDSETNLSSATILHPLLAVNVRAELSASYHNRRLVIWEPFIEAFDFGARGGLNLSQMSLISPILVGNESENGGKTQAFQTPTRSNEPLRRITRLLGSPLSPFRSEGKIKVEPANGDFLFSEKVNLCYERLCRNSVVQSLVTVDSKSRSLPGDSPVDWIQSLGFPDDKKIDCLHSGVQIFFHGHSKLNINVTGDCIETVAGLIEPDTRSTAQASAHKILNLSGMPIRIHECLESDRLRRGERATKLVLESGKEAPLLLKRTLSQACDPHAGYVYLEICIPDRGSRLPRILGSHDFDYCVPARVPVDHVGVYEYIVQPKEERRRSMNWLTNNVKLIVRVIYESGTKVVSIESPLFIKNVSESNLNFRLEESSTRLVLWQGSTISLEDEESTERKSRSLPIPSYLVNGIDEGRNSLYVSYAERRLFPESSSEVTLEVPPPFSKTSVESGTVGVVDIALEVGNDNKKTTSRHFNICKVRVGTTSGKDGYVGEEPVGTFAPEQRMLLIRSSISIHNHLPMSVVLAFRASVDEPTETLDWVDIGIVAPGGSANWTEWDSDNKKELRLKLTGGEYSSIFPSWSSTLAIPAAASLLTKRLGSIELHDMWENSLFLSTKIDTRTHNHSTDRSLSIDQYVSTLPRAGLSLNIFVPRILVDSTGLNLAFRSGKILAGQVDEFADEADESRKPFVSPSVGLGELVDDVDFASMPGHHSSKVMLIGSESSAHLQIRRSGFRVPGADRIPSWSEPIPLRKSSRAVSDVLVFPPFSTCPEDEIERPSESPVPYAIRSHLTRAPNHYGGDLGTMVLQLSCRYQIANKLGRDIEIQSSQGTCYRFESGAHTSAFHFNQSDSLKLRPVEFGWAWSGKFHAKENASEVSLQIRHTMKDDVLMTTLNFITAEKGGTCTIVIEPAMHPPYRVENQSLLALQYRQVQSIFGSAIGISSPSTMVMPFHRSDFAWDEPIYGRKAIVVEVDRKASANSYDAEVGEKFLGRFNMDHLTPGTSFQLPYGLRAFIETDGPTRVLRICDESFDEHHESLAQPRKNIGPVFLSRVEVSLSIGISVIDWEPKELLYIDLSSLSLSHARSLSADEMAFSINGLTVNNQLWVTPYPVAISLGPPGKGSKLRRQDAISASIRRSLLSKWLEENLTLIEKAEIHLDSVNANFDGELIGMVIGMARKSIRLLSKPITSSIQLSRLEKILSENTPTKSSIETLREDLRTLYTKEMYSAVDIVASVGLSSKLRSMYRPLTSSKDTSTRLMQKDVGDRASSLVRSKYYVERLRVSPVRAQLSWTGIIPISAIRNNWLRPSLTFEGFPLHLGSMSISHVYGPLKGQITSIKSQFVTTRRILGLLAGLFRPSFLVRACFFTSSEMIAAALGLSADFLKKCESHLQRRKAISPSVLKPVLEPAFAFSCLFCHRISSVSAALASSLRYNPRGSRSRETLVRSRNPRLFAKVDGKDVLVEYVEGESAGRAILSRVRMGVYLGEGYAFHVEAKDPSNSKEYILMLSLESLLLLEGDLSPSFCDIIFEIPLKSIVFVDTEHIQSSNMMRLVFRYVARKQDGSGLVELETKVVLVPRTMIDTLENTLKYLCKHNV